MDQGDTPKHRPVVLSTRGKAEDCWVPRLKQPQKVPPQRPVGPVPPLAVSEELREELGRLVMEVDNRTLEGQRKAAMQARVDALYEVWAHQAWEQVKVIYQVKSDVKGLAGGKAYELEEVKLSKLLATTQARRPSPGRALSWMADSVEQLASLHKQQLGGASGPRWLDIRARHKRLLRAGQAEGGPFAKHWKEGLEQWRGLITLLGAHGWGVLSQSQNFVTLAAFVVPWLREAAAEGFGKSRAEQTVAWGVWCEEALAGGAKWAHAYTKLAEDFQQDLVEFEGSFSAAPALKLAKEVELWSAAWGEGGERAPLEGFPIMPIPEKLRPSQLREVARTFKESTIAADGFHPRHFIHLSDDCLECMSSLLHLSMATGRCPGPSRSSSSPSTGRRRGGGGPLATSSPLCACKGR